MADSKPTFNVNVRPAVTTLEVDGVVYNAKPVEPENWYQVGEGFKQGVMSAQLNLVHSGYINRNSDDKLTKERAGRIVSVAHNKWVTGNTALYGGNSGNEWVFAQDFPEVKEGRIAMNQDELVARLEAPGKRIINDNLHVSADGQVRAMKREGFRAGEYTIDQMLTSNQPIWITGDEQAPRKMADIMEIAKKPGYLTIPPQGNITVPGLIEGGFRVCLSGYGWVGFNGGRHSFGVRQ